MENIKVRRHFDFTVEMDKLVDELVVFLEERDGRPAKRIDAINYAIRKAIGGNVN